MNATIYKEISDAKDFVAIEAKKTIYENFEGLRLDDKIILVNGKPHTPDYIVKEGDIVVVRSIPHGITAAIIVLAVAVVGIGIYAGIKLYQLKKQAEELEDRMKNMNDSVSNIPYLKGASNSVATGKSQPYIIGEHLFTPYLLSNSFKKISGTDGINQYYYAILEAGFNKQRIKKLSCDDVVLRDFGDGTATQEGQYLFDEDSVFYDSDSFFEVSQDGNAFEESEFNKKYVIEESGSQLKKANEEDYEPLIYTLSENTRSVELCILINGLRRYNDSGDKLTRDIDVIPAYSLDSGETWTNFTFNINGTQGTHFAGNTNKQLRFIATKEFTYSDIKDLTAPIMVRVSTPTYKYNGTALEDVYVQFVQSLIYDPDKSEIANAFVNEKVIDDTERSVSTLIGLKIKATASNEDKLKKINIISSGVARTWNGTIWSTSKVPTRNPAAWYLEVLTSNTHLPSKLDDSEIDLDSFGELYEYCETENLKIDMVLTDSDVKENILSAIGQVCFSSLYQDIYGKVSVATDSVKENAIALLNTQNLISFDNKKDISRLTDGIKIQYTSRDGGYVSDTYLVMRDGVTRGSESILRDMTVVGITEYNHIVKYARRLMAIESLRPKEVTASVGKEGIYYTPLSKVLVQHPSLKIGLGSAEIKAIIVDGTDIVGLQLYDPIEYDSANTDGFGVVIQCVSETYCTPLPISYTADSNGRVDEITFITPIALSASVIPHSGDILSFGYLDSGEFNTITSPMLITGIEPTDTGHKLTLVDYNEAVYTVGTIPEYTPNLTIKKTGSSVPSDIPAASTDSLADAVNVIVTGTDTSIPSDVTSVTGTAYKDFITIEWEFPNTGIDNNIAHFIIDLSTNGGSTWTSYIQKGTSFDLYYDRAVHGYPTVEQIAQYRIRIKAVNNYGLSSANYSPSEAGASLITSGYLGWTPVVPSVSTRTSGRGVTLAWSTASDWYGSGQTDLQIAKGYTVDAEGEIVLITDTGTLTAYAPAIGLDPSANYENYKEGLANGYLTRTGSTFAISLPLYGQNETEPVSRDTPYYVRARSRTNPAIASSESAWSDWQLVYAMATSAQDVVRAWKLDDLGEKVRIDGSLGAQQIYAEALAAISANLGVITDGAMVGSANNYWALSRVYDTDGITVLYYEGAMRVGGADQYLKVTPVVVGGVVTSYTIDFKVGTFTVTATGSTINGDFVVKSLDGLTTWASIDKTTGAFTILEPSITSYTNQVATTKFAKDVAFPLSDLSRVCQINGDGVPVFPDNVAGRTYWHDKDWTVTTDWTGASGSTLSIENSTLKVVTTAGNASLINSVNSAYQNKLIRIIIRSSTEISSVYTVIGSAVYTAMKLTKISADRYAADIYWSRTGSDSFAIIPNYPATTALTWYLESIYIGSGLYDTPVYDKACCSRATNYGALPVKGTRGQALSFNGGQYLQFDNPVIGTSGTIAFKFKRGTIWIDQNILNNATGSTSGLLLRFTSGNVLSLALNNGTAYGYGTQTVTDTSSWHDAVISISASSIIFYIDGVASETIASPQVMTLATAVLTVGSSSGFNALIADFRYDSRIWTQADVTRYHNGDDAVDSQQKAITAVPHSIVTRDASGNIEGNNFVAKASDLFQIKIGDSASASAYESIAIGGASLASGIYSKASGFNSEAIGVASIADGVEAHALADNSIAIGNTAYAGGGGSVEIGNDGYAQGLKSIGIGSGADTTLPHEINLGNRIRYLEFASTATQATVYTALSALMNPTVGIGVGAMGKISLSFNELSRPTSTQVRVSRIGIAVVETFNSGDATAIGTDLQIQFVQYADV